MKKIFFVKSYVWLVLLILCVIFFVLKTCINKPILEKGKWVNIKDAPISCGYILKDSLIYGVQIPKAEENSWTDSLINSLDEWLTPIAYVDVESFMVNINDDEEQFYAKDNNNVYYPVEMILYDGYSPYSATFEGDIIIPNADPKTFKYLGEGYAVDKNSMYYYGGKIDWNDSIIQSLKTQQ